MLPCEEVGRWFGVVILPADFSEGELHATFSFGNEEKTAGEEGIGRG